MARPTFTAEQIDAALMAVIAWAGNCSAAARALKAEGKLTVSDSTLGDWIKDRHAVRYEELRDKYAAQLEGQLVHEYRDVARQSVEVQKLALERAHARLVKGEDQDPSRTAANAARVAQSMTDKMLSLSGRPTSIREDRNIEEVLRSLAARGIIEVPAEDVQEEPKELGA